MYFTIILLSSLKIHWTLWQYYKRYRYLDSKRHNVAKHTAADVIINKMWHHKILERAQQCRSRKHVPTRFVNFFSRYQINSLVYDWWYNVIVHREERRNFFRHLVGFGKFKFTLNYQDRSSTFLSLRPLLSLYEHTT